MPTNYYLSLFLTMLLLTSCSGQISQESFVTQQPSPNPEVGSTPTLKIIESTPTHTLVPTTTPQIQPSETPTPIVVENLPQLSEVVLSSNDIENLDEYDSSPLVLAAADVINELQNSCLWDCIKYRYSLARGTLTILLLRAGDHQKAESTVKTLRGDFLKTVGFEYTTDDLSSMPSASWVIVDAASSSTDYRTSAAGIAYGSIVVLVTYSQNFCEYTVELGKYCKGDLMGLALDSVEFLNAQIQKLETAGYTK